MVPAPLAVAPMPVWVPQLGIALWPLPVREVTE